MRVHCLAILLCIVAFSGIHDASAAGDPQRGREIATACSACHGLDGSSPSPAFPILGGQHQEYLVQAMLAYQAGTRADSIMGGAIRTLRRQQIEDVAAWFSTQTGLRTNQADRSVGGPATTAAATNATAQASTAGAAAALSGIAAPARAASDPAEDSGCPVAGSETRDADGDGWFDICSIQQLQAIQTLGSGKGQRTALALTERNTRRYELVRDLDAAAIASFEPVGNCGTENNCMVAGDKYGFAGALDGNGHAIRNLVITRPTTGGVGLFGTLARTGVVRNLQLENATVTGLHGTGALVGANFGLVADCKAQVKVRGRLATGGLVGGNAGQVKGCQVSGEVTAEAAVGGLAGDMNGSVTDSSADMRVSAGKSAGGLIGLNTTGEVRNSHAAGTVIAGDNAGGLVGVNTDALISNSYATTTVVSSGTNAGGLVGFNSQSRIRSSHATGAVTGRGAVGALTGRNNGSLRNVHATGTVTVTHVNTVQRFAKGDILVAATIMDNPTDDHGGTGRIIQYDENLQVKGELYLDGTKHKVGGLAFAPDRTLWAFSQLTPSIAEISPDGVQKPVRTFSDRKLSSVTFGKDGSLYFGEHMMGKATGHPAVTTKFSLLPGRDVIGDGHVFRYGSDGKLLREYRTEANGGLFGFLAVTSTVLADNDTRMIYISETGRRVMQYDLANDRQLPDLADFSKDPAVPMVLVMNPTPDGQLLISTGKGFILVDARSGKVLRDYPLQGMGWAAVNSSADGQYALIGNFFTGDIVKVRLADGAVVAKNNIGQKESLSGVAQFPG